MSGGVVYAVEFSTGVVKVGRSENPVQRLSSHRASGRPFGVSVVGEWVGPVRDQFERDERELIAWCSGRAGSEVVGREYFTGIAFEDLVWFAEGLKDRGPVVRPVGSVEVLKQSLGWGYAEPVSLGVAAELPVAEVVDRVVGLLRARAALSEELGPLVQVLRQTGVCPDVWNPRR